MSAVSSEAKAHHRAYNREYLRRKRATPEGRAQLLIIAERWRAKDPAKAARIRRESVARWRAANPELARQISRKARGVPEPTRPKPDMCEVPECARRAAVVDHDHTTGGFRGWLCHPCNLVANKNHTPASLRAVADYLERGP
jgi:hypothetical protein